MYYVSNHIQQPTTKVAVSVVATDGEVFEGSFFTTGIQRMSDLLNGENAFVPFEAFDGTIHLLNRRAISHVAPGEGDGEPLPEPARDPGTLGFVAPHGDDAAPPKDPEDQPERFAAPSREQGLEVEGAAEAVFVESPITDAEADPVVVGVKSAAGFHGLDGSVTTGADLRRHTNRGRGRSGLPGLIRWAGAWADRSSPFEIVAFTCLTLFLLTLTMMLSLTLLGGTDRPDALPDYRNGMAALASGDYDTARGVFQPLAEHGVSKAQTKLALMYEKGYGMPQDYDEARKWYQDAAAQGNVEAQMAVGLIYFNGMRVPQDLVRAHMWLSLAASQGDSVAATHRNGVAAAMSSDDISEAERLARAWREGRKTSE